MFRQSCFLALIFLFQFSFCQTSADSASIFLQQFVGRWTLIPSTLELNPAPPNLDTASFSLEMACELGADSLSIHCQFKGSKEILAQVVRSSGQELLIFEPGSSLIYKLGGVRNVSSQQELNGMFVTMGKGLISGNKKLELTEFLVGKEGPAGRHFYEWISPEKLKESSIYLNEKGEVLRRSSWTLKKLQ